MKSDDFFPLHDLESVLSERLIRPLPGIEAQRRMAPSPRPGGWGVNPPGGGIQTAGVLLLLFHRRKRPHFVLTRRTDRVLHHRGQICLPGGERLPNETPLQAAVRETEEELGISPTGIRILGGLTPLDIPHSRFRVHPFVASFGRSPVFHPHQDEVAEILEVPLAHLFEPERIRMETSCQGGREILIPYYAFSGQKVWGATAMILAEFSAILRP